MIIIKPSLEEKPTDNIAENSARAPFFLVFDRDESGKESYLRTIKNPFTWGGGAWPAAVDLLQEEWCELFIAKTIWEKMKNKLDEYNISYEIID